MAMVVDPICGMRIDSEEAAGTIEYEGKTYYFCSQIATTPSKRTRAPTWRESDRTAPHPPSSG